MKLLLAAVNAKYIHSNLAVYSMKAYCRAFAAHIELAEYTINQQEDEILKDLYRKKPEILCFSCYIWNISFIKELIRNVKKILPDTVIWAGGPEVSYDAEQFLEEMPEVFGVMCGEGEETFRELTQYYVNLERNTEKGTELEKIDGIVFRKGKEIQKTAPRAILDMDTLVFPYQDMELFHHRIIYYESSRGCPFSCSYCLSSIDKKLRFRSTKLVKQELQFFLDNQVPQVKFVDRTFNCKKEHALEIWRYIQEHDNQVTNFHFEIAADLLTEEEIALIHTMRPGLIQLEIGVQSTNEDTIREIRRKTSFEKISQKVRQVQAGKNVHQHLDLIAGLPLEGYDSFRKSFDDVYGLRPQQLQLGFLKVLKGSYMYEKREEYGCVYKQREPYEVLSTNWLSYGEICRLKGIEDMVEVYYNSGQFTRTIEALEKEFSDAFAMYEALADFYEKKGYFGISHTRIRRYEILLEFLEEQGKEDLAYFRERMVFDLYARENLKTRPVWAGEQKLYKEQIQNFYRKEAEEPRLLRQYGGYQPRQLEKMTHLEVFTYDVLSQKREKGQYPVLFDYKERSPLTHDARVCAVEFEQRKEDV
ncbi:B12-binding domain-containing radical SAM protein [Blautia sp. HCN-20427]|uniref:B12-binding domain-containing radical SAM protein n=1 Tax=Blautia sp. HCN-20427 TaxID=3134659 RepID=UPI0026208A6B|nr:B12-binding domain-containing radical SAM protein [uncultured Blautia sp.]